MAQFADGRIECFVGPQDLGAADDLEVEIIGFIDGATKTLDIAVQELDSEPIAEALIRARGTDCHTNLNHVVVFHDNGVAKEYAEEFAEIYSGEFGRGRIGEIPATHDVARVPIKVLFAPDHGPEAEIIKQLLKCPTGGQIAFAIFTFSGSSGIDDAMLVLAGADREIAGAVDRAQGGATWAASKWLVEGDIDLRVPLHQPGFRKLHHKLMVIDHAIVLAGSFNYTEPANLYNDENLFVIGSPYEESEGVIVDQAACAAIADYFRTEIDRIMAHSEPWSD